MTAAALAEPIVVQDADHASKLEAIANSGACEAGRVVALDFAAVRAAVGDRWAARREDIHCRIEREIARQVPRSTIFFRLTESEYLVSFIDVHGAAAQVQAFNIMEELLIHFLGRCDPQDLVVKCVSAVTAHGVETRPLSRDVAEQEKMKQDRQAAAPQPVAASTCALIEGPAEHLNLRLTPQDIVHVSSGLKIGTRISVNLSKLGSERLLCFREEYMLSTNSLLQANIQTITAARQIMEDAERPAVFTLPLFLQPMTTSRGRNLILDELRRLRAIDHRRLVIELTGIERGTPSSRLLETSWQLRPYCRVVSGRAQLERSALTALCGAKLGGIHLSARDLGLGVAQKAAGLLAAGQSARNLAPVIMAVDLTDADTLNVCAIAGFTHATLPVGLI